MNTSEMVEEIIRKHEPLSRRVVIMERPTVVAELERMATERGHSLSAEIRGAIRQRLRREEPGVKLGRKPTQVGPDTPIGQLVICIRTLISSAAGSCALGRIVPDDDPGVLVAPECFTSLFSQVERSA
jgi:hypothetical protein